ncbi:2-oxo acid dehydrogenase subunit E2 [Nocardioides sp. AN3]
MSIEVHLPALGESVTEGVITRWLKAVGDQVEAGEPLFEVSTDKVDTEIPSPLSGTLTQIRAKEDDSVQVGAVVALVASGQGQGTAPEPPASAEVHHVDQTEAPPPAVAPSVSPVPERPATPDSRSASPTAHHSPASDKTAPVSSVRGTTVAMTRMRKLIAQRMLHSLQTSAQLTSVVEVDVTAVARLRSRVKDEFHAREGVRLSFLPFFAKAALDALKQHPSLNAVIDPDSDEITYHDAEHLAIAIDHDRGLVAPVIRHAGDLSVTGLARAIADLASRARSESLSSAELSGGTFTLTNTGSRGALFDTPIINQPQVAILGTGTVVRRPVIARDGELGESIAARDMVYFALTYDHRIVDGADAARYLTDVRRRLEQGVIEL